MICFSQGIDLEDYCFMVCGLLFFGRYIPIMLKREKMMILNDLFFTRY
jgi:hypothetical protein